MNRECKCGGHLGTWVCKKEDEKIYENLFQCIDCGKDYILKDGEFKFISKMEFKRILGGRKMNDKEIKTRIVQSRCMADMLIWLGFEYTKSEEGYIFERNYKFDLVWRDIHVLRQKYRKQ